MSANFWNNLQPDTKSKLEEIAQIKKYEKGEIVFSETDPFKGFVVIRTGKFKIYNLNPNGKEAILRVVAGAVHVSELVLLGGKILLIN